VIVDRLPADARLDSNLVYTGAGKTLPTKYFRRSIQDRNSFCVLATFRVVGRFYDGIAWTSHGGKIMRIDVLDNSV
jgi:hypothetical protein